MFNHESLSHARFGPDSRSTTILVKARGRQLKMQSWHELYEASAKTVATDKGLVPLDGRPRFDVLLAEPVEYLFYRLVWNELRLRAASLIPSESKPGGRTHTIAKRRRSLGGAGR